MPKPQRWVFLRGLAREAGHWGAFVDQFKKENPGVEVLPLDLPGFGSLHRQSSPLSIAGIRTLLHRQYGELEQKPTGLLAVSLGGMVALDWASAHPELFEALVIINSSLADQSRFYHRLRWQIYPKFFKSLGMIRAEAREKNILEVISNRPQLYESTAKEWAELARRHPIKLRNVLNQLLAAATYRHKKSPTLPATLVLVGMGDRLVDPSCSEQIHRLYDTEIEYHPWAGHDLTLDDGEWVARAVNQWIVQSVKS